MEHFLRYWLNTLDGIIFHTLNLWCCVNLRLLFVFDKIWKRHLAIFLFLSSKIYTALLRSLFWSPYHFFGYLLLLSFLTRLFRVLSFSISFFASCPFPLRKIQIVNKLQLSCLAETWFIINATSELCPTPISWMITCQITIGAIHKVRRQARGGGLPMSMQIHKLM